MSNRQRIIDATVELMNERGSAVGTTQLVEHLEISPGNLYYHFRNREEILTEVLTRLQLDLDDVLILEVDEAPTPAQLAQVLIGGAKVLWQYRFFFSSSIELVAQDKSLTDRYRQFCERGTAQVRTILTHLLASPAGAQKLKKSEINKLAEILWVLWTSWPRYAEILAGKEGSEQQILRNHESLELALKPYLEPKFYKAVVAKTRTLHEQPDSSVSTAIRY
ncbi:MAG: TetR/AcrR family transcriptional regulator [Pseudomonadota bacterium]